MKTPMCPICKIELSIKNIDDKYDIQCCSSCKREFYQISEKDDERQKSILDLQSDLETVSSESDSSSPVLLCDESDYRGFTPEYQKKKGKENYLQKYFPSAKITNQEYQPY